jgi:hypothetical protein
VDPSGWAAGEMSESRGMLPSESEPHVSPTTEESSSEQVVLCRYPSNLHGGSQESDNGRRGTMGVATGQASSSDGAVERMHA